MKTDASGGVDKLIHELRQERDELKVQMHLASMELKEEWGSLTDRLDALNHRYEPLKEAVEETADDVWESMKFVGCEIREGFKRIRKSLSE